MQFLGKASQLRSYRVTPCGDWRPPNVLTLWLMAMGMVTLDLTWVKHRGTLPMTIQYNRSSLSCPISQPSLGSRHLSPKCFVLTLDLHSGPTVDKASSKSANFSLHLPKWLSTKWCLPHQQSCYNSGQLSKKEDILGFFCLEAENICSNSTVIPQED